VWRSWLKYLSPAPPPSREGAWRLLTTLPDLPSAQSLAGALNAAGLTARVSSDAGVLGQAAPSRIYVSAAQLPRAREYLAPSPLAPEDSTRSRP